MLVIITDEDAGEIPQLYAWQFVQFLSPPDRMVTMQIDSFEKADCFVNNPRAELPTKNKSYPNHRYREHGQQ